MICLQAAAVSGVATIGNDDSADASLNDIRPPQKTLSQVCNMLVSGRLCGSGSAGILYFKAFHSIADHRGPQVSCTKARTKDTDAPIQPRACFRVASGVENETAPLLHTLGRNQKGHSSCAGDHGQVQEKHGHGK